MDTNKDGVPIRIRDRHPADVLCLRVARDDVEPEHLRRAPRADAERANGIGDNTRGLALMLAVIRAMDAGKFRTAGDILFVGNVGEEGEGDLRGVKFLLRKGKYKDRIKQFIAIDGGDQGGITRGGGGGVQGAGARAVRSRRQSLLRDRAVVG